MSSDQGPDRMAEWERRLLDKHEAVNHPARRAGGAVMPRPAPETIPTDLLVDEFRDVVARTVRDPDVVVARRADALQAEILRRAAW